MKWFFGILLSFLVGILLLLYLKKDEVEDLVVSYINENISFPNNVEVYFSKIAFSFPCHLSLKEVTLLKERSFDISLENCEVDLNPLALLKKEIKIDHLTIEKALVNFKNSTSPSLENVPEFQISSFDIHELWIKNEKLKLSGSLDTFKRVGHVEAILNDNIPISFKLENEEIDLKRNEMLLNLKGSFNTGKLFFSYQNLGSFFSNYSFSFEKGLELTNMDGKANNLTFKGSFKIDPALNYYSDLLLHIPHYQYGDLTLSQLNVNLLLSHPFLELHLLEGSILYKDFKFDALKGIVNLNYRDLHGFLSLSNEKFHVQTDVEWNAEKIVTLDQFYINAQEFSLLNGKCLIENNTIPAAFSLLSKDALLQVEGILDLTQEKFSCSTMEGKYKDHFLKLQKELTLTHAWPFLLTPLDLQIDEGFIKGDHFHIQGEKLPLHLVCNESGFFDIEGELKENETGDFNVKVYDLSFAKNILQDSLLKAQLKAHLQKDQITGSGELLGIGKEVSDFDFSLPITFSLKPFSFHLERDKEFHLSLNLNSKIESLLEIFFPDNIIALTGDTHLNVRADGKLRNPHIHGDVFLQNGSYELLNIGGYVKDLSCRGHFKNSTLYLDKIWASQDEGGKLNGSGEIHFNSTLPFFLELASESLHLTPASYIDIWVKGKVRLEGNKEKGLLKGVITSDEVNVALPDEIPELTEWIPVTYLNQPHAATPSEKGWTLLYDLEMDIPNNCTIKSKNLTSLWKGKAHLDGALQLNGSCKCTQGQYLLNGKAFDINEGLITFGGDPEKKTTLYIIASKDLDKIRADLILKGPIKHPSLSFRSNPPLPQREILSWILFNRGTSEINQFQGSQLNESISNLTATKNSDMLTQIRDRIGIDRIDINRGDNGSSNEVSLQMGKYISQGIFISVNKSITAEANRLQLEADVIKNVKVEAEVGDNAAGQLRLKWKKDY
jgi:hypothetical protein